MVLLYFKFSYLPQRGQEGRKRVQNRQEVQLSRKLCVMRQIEILRALYFIQLLILVSGGWNPPDARTHFNVFRRTIWSPERFCQFCLV